MDSGRRFEQLRHHNVFLGPPSAWDGLFDAASYQIWDERLARGPLHFYVHAPARTDPSVVQRETDDAIMVLVQRVEHRYLVATQFLSQAHMRLLELLLDPLLLEALI